MNSLSSTASEDTVLTNLLTYCTTRKITISPSVTIRRVPGKGLGVYSTAPLKPGERIMHVPTSALFTTASIPLSFCSKQDRAKFPVHALLAAYLAFGPSEETKEKLQPWMATWPRVEDFTGTIPLFWPERLRERVPAIGRNEQGEENEFQPVPPSLTGSWLPSASPLSLNEPLEPGLLDAQVAKFKSHLRKTATLFPQSSPDILNPNSALHQRYIHSWSAVNSRCFYYVPPGHRAPADSNEAMALCPAMDLFNHSNEPQCGTSYDRKGFYVTVNPARNGDKYGGGAIGVREGEELTLCYGAHGEDGLWGEYGFLMGNNERDGITLDEIVLAGVTESEKRVLQEARHLGEYYLRPSEGGRVSWRTEVVSYLGVLSMALWWSFVEGQFDPEEAEQKALEERGKGGGGKRRKRDDSATVGGGEKEKDAPSVRAKRRQIAWITVMQREAEKSLRGLLEVSSPSASSHRKGAKNDKNDKNNINGKEESPGDELTKLFADEDIKLEAQGFMPDKVPEVRTSQAKMRHKMCVQRWKQIWDMAREAIALIRARCPALHEEEGAGARDGEAHSELERRINDFLAT